MDRFDGQHRELGRGAEVDWGSLVAFLCDALAEAGHWPPHHLAGASDRLCPRRLVAYERPRFGAHDEIPDGAKLERLTADRDVLVLDDGTLGTIAHANGE